MSTSELSVFDIPIVFREFNIGNFLCVFGSGIKCGVVCDRSYCVMCLIVGKIKYGGAIPAHVRTHMPITYYMINNYFAFFFGQKYQLFYD